MIPVKAMPMCHFKVEFGYSTIHCKKRKVLDQADYHNCLITHARIQSHGKLGVTHSPCGLALIFRICEKMWVERK